MGNVVRRGFIQALPTTCTKQLDGGGIVIHAQENRLVSLGFWHTIDAVALESIAISLINDICSKVYSSQSALDGVLTEPCPA